MNPIFNSSSLHMMPVVSTESETNLHKAIKERRLDLVESFLQCEDVNAADENGNTPLHLAVEIGRDDIVQYLFKRSDININAINKNQFTPLHLAVREGLDVVAAYLLLNEKIDVISTIERMDTGDKGRLLGILTNLDSFQRRYKAIIEKLQEAR